MLVYEKTKDTTAARIAANGSVSVGIVLGKSLHLIAKLARGNQDQQNYQAKKMV